MIFKSKFAKFLSTFYSLVLLSFIVILYSGIDPNQWFVEYFGTIAISTIVMCISYLFGFINKSDFEHTWDDEFTVKDKISKMNHVCWIFSIQILCSFAYGKELQDQTLLNSDMIRLWFLAPTFYFIISRFLRRFSAVENKLHLEALMNRNDPKFMLKAIKLLNAGVLSEASPALLNNKKFMTKSLKINENVFNFFSTELKENKEFLLKTIPVNMAMIKHIPNKIKSDKQFILQAVQLNGDILEYASENLKSDKEVILEAVKYNGHALRFASNELKKDKYFILQALKQNGSVLLHISEKLKSDREVVLEAVKQNGYAIGFASNELKSDRTIVLEAVKQNGSVLSFVSIDFRSDREVVLEAVKRDGMSLECVSEELKSDLEVVLEAVKQNIQALSFRSETLNSNEVFWSEIAQYVNTNQSKIMGETGFSDADINAFYEQITTSDGDRSMLSIDLEFIEGMWVPK